ncbi:serine--tRNA ligase [Acetobacter pasteurianus]|uniref:Serine--tRNA ligase n=1 Tax=Acetobacter pasteurianus TaxID=438 RepID=A0A1A0CY22_ACEPA|nr:serine--tRNA ligase [Acetobacter pasteurianus]OAZ67217.1 Serine--tRNA ligase [Acetobacter pasteurianus]QHM91922.1 serine--tRNA ligase [Acetobacter pasteurianus]RCL08117.1 serine--tRNA ligase [Acetobacter pasteurianus]GAB30570.1 seryl-tRNA synthetase [Acetobacter pasteurianus subsp. pasteurianus LMG 1262 = NBRC 106471]GCD50422.1 seryl-tRNA synthetase [Acetobacter pasteurianus subsp. pasteurianus LMG 1262 = NBRC 106471]
MHDIRALRADPAAFDADLARRGVEPVSAKLLAWDEERRQAQTVLQEKQGRRKALAREIGALKRNGGDSSDLEAEGLALRAEMEALEEQVNVLGRESTALLANLPNRLDATVPEGPDESANVVQHEWGTKPTFTFTPKQHFELGETLKQMDFATAAKLSGSRFVVLRGGIARLARALGQFMLDLHVTEHGYTETQVPVMVNDDAMYGTDKLPKFADQSFRTEDGRWLIPTAEVPLTASVSGDILEASALPLRMTALSQCFRSEAGAAGRDVRGMLRQHQFEKVEMVSVTTPEESDAEHERMTRCAEKVLEKLNIPYRRVLLCAGDTGFGAAKTFDLEAWLPGQDAWREISSCSNTRDFQARRMNARYRPQAGAAPAFVHTLNGSGLAVGRTLIAVMENYQNEDGSVTVPDVLRPYMGGIEKIS